MASILEHTAYDSSSVTNKERQSSLSYYYAESLKAWAISPLRQTLLRVVRLCVCMSVSLVHPVKVVWRTAVPGADLRGGGDRRTPP